MPKEDPANPADEARRAAEEAAEIGGPDPYPDVDPEDRPVVESGEGEAEGWELAEEDLRRNAEHDDGYGHPLEDAFSPEEEADVTGAEYGEPDAYKENERE